MIYFDSAATTLQKPESVYAAVQRTMRACASVGRGGHAAADAAARVVYACRTEAAELFDAAPEQVVFTMNATHGLNIALRSLVRPGGRVVLSGMEHNAVTRPLAALGAQIETAGAPPFAPERAARGLCARPAAGSGCGGVHACFKCLRQCAARVSRCRAVPGTRASRARHRCLAVRGNAAGQPARDGCGLHRHAGAQGAVWPAGDGPAAVRRGGGAAAAGRHGEQFAQSEHAGFPAGPPRGGHAQRLRHRRPAGWPALCARAAAGRAAGGGARTHGPCGARPSGSCRAWRCSRGRGRAAFCRSAAGTSTARRPPPAWRRPGSPCGPGCTVRRWPTAAVERSRPERSG